MFIKSITINNYKSLGTDNNKLFLSTTTTPLIGRNGSGKTNIINALAEIDLKNKMTKAFVDTNENRINESEEKISYTIELTSSANELNDYKIAKDTIIVIDKENYSIEGGLLQYFNLEIKNNINEFLKTLEENPFQVPQNKLMAYADQIKQIENFDLSKIDKKLSNIKTTFGRNSLFEKYAIAFNEIQEQLLHVYSMLPDFIYINKSKKLSAEYNLQSIKNELTTKEVENKSLLSNLLQLIEYDGTKFIDLVTTYGPPKSISTEKKINNKIDTYINSSFNEFYNNENIKLNLKIQRGKITFMIAGDDNSLIELSEKSAGLQWYLNSFIYLKSKNLPLKNAVFLLDEPGTSLHINAQDDLLNYFHKLAEINQIVYTTHSPYMIPNTKVNIGDIRLIEKNKYGYTQIFNSTQSYKIPGPQSETLTPIIECLGMNLNNTIGPSLNKTNLITEGISDYYYIKALAKILEFDINSYNIFPSTGAANVINLCSILIGWGCKFIAIFDYDKAGVNSGGKQLEKKLLLELNKNYIYLKDIDEKKIKVNDFFTNPIVIEDLVTVEELDNFKNENKISNKLGKVIVSKLYYDNAIKKNDTYSDKCKENFKELFNRIENIKFV